LDSIIFDHLPLGETYIPNKLIARESHIRQIFSCLFPLLNKQRPVHIWLYGKPGTGKTSCATYALRTLEEKQAVRTIIINCWKKRTFYEILDEMISQFRVLRADEHRTSFKLEKLRKFINGKPLVVMLDEVDRIKNGELSTILYNLESVLNAGIICISNTTEAMVNLEERVRSRLNPRVLHFSAYTQKQLLEIISFRAEHALAPKSWSATALQNIAKTAHGDARIAIGTLQRAAIAVEQRRGDRITPATLKQQINASKQARQKGILNSLTDDHRILYRIIADKGKALSGELWDEYLQHCNQLDRKPLSSRSFSDYCNRLTRSGLVTSERARMKGKVRMFQANC